MPTYQYACTECDHAFEQFQSFSDDALTVCPQCQGRLRKKFNAVGVVFKGSGFYRNDSRSDQKSGVGGSSSSAEKTETSEKSTDGSSDTSNGGGESGGSKKSSDTTTSTSPVKSTEKSGEKKSSPTSGSTSAA